MRFFENFPKDSTCPVCNTNKRGKCFLMPVQGTSDGSICEGQPVHMDCLGEKFMDRLLYNKEYNIIYFVTEK